MPDPRARQPAPPLVLLLVRLALLPDRPDTAQGRPEHLLGTRRGRLWLLPGTEQFLPGTLPGRPEYLSAMRPDRLGLLLDTVIQEFLLLDSSLAPRSARR